MYKVIGENAAKRDEFVGINIIKDLIRKDDLDYTFKLRNAKIRQELGKVSAPIDEVKIKIIIDKLNIINISIYFLVPRLFLISGLTIFLTVFFL